MTQERAFDICLEMLEQRNYELVSVDKENLNITALKTNNEQISVYFNNAPKFDTKSMKEIIFLMEEEGIDHSIVIYKDNITAATANVLSQTIDLRIELFAEENLQINITKHVLQPQFSKLSDEENIEFKEKFGTKFPILRYDKPISRFYDFSKGDVIQIERLDDTYAFRIVR
jgi:DNA-directed RNA polymerase subunit H (RpoH/RPB5)